jgi:hypothetical protein
VRPGPEQWWRGAVAWEVAHLSHAIGRGKGRPPLCILRRCNGSPVSEHRPSKELTVHGRAFARAYVDSFGVYSLCGGA